MIIYKFVYLLKILLKLVLFNLPPKKCSLLKSEISLDGSLNFNLLSKTFKINLSLN